MRKILFIMMMVLTMIGTTEAKVRQNFKAKDSKHYYEESGQASSNRASIAEEKARLDAMSKLALRSAGVVKTFTENYNKEYDLGESFETAGIFESLTQNFANARFTDVKVVKTKFTEHKKTHTTTCRVKIKVNKEQVVNSIVNTTEELVKKNKKSNIDFNREQFREYVKENLK